MLITEYIMFDIRKLNLKNYHDLIFIDTERTDYDTMIASISNRNQRPQSRAENGDAYPQSGLGASPFSSAQKLNSSVTLKRHLKMQNTHVYRKDKTSS